MKLKINALYMAGLALLVGAASVGDGLNALLPAQWGGHLAACTVLAVAGVVCLGYGRGLEIEQAEKARLRRIQRRHARTEEPEYRKHRRNV